MEELIHELRKGISMNDLIIRYLKIILLFLDKRDPNLYDNRLSFDLKNSITFLENLKDIIPNDVNNKSKLRKINNIRNEIVTLWNCLENKLDVDLLEVKRNILLNLNN